MQVTRVAVREECPERGPWGRSAGMADRGRGAAGGPPCRSIHPEKARKTWWLRGVSGRGCGTIAGPGGRGSGLPVPCRPDVRCGLPGLRSLEAGCAPPSWLRWPPTPAPGHGQPPRGCCGRIAGPRGCGQGLPVSCRPDVRCGLPGLRSLEAGCTPPSWPRWPPTPAPGHGQPLADAAGGSPARGAAARGSGYL